MGFGEIAYRGRQEANKIFERVGGIGNGHAAGYQLKKSLARDALGEFRGGANGDFHPLARALRERFQNSGAKRFFAGATDPQSVQLLRQHAPEACAAIIAAADRVLAGRFTLLGYDDLYFGDPVDWRLDPISGRRSPLTHWSRIDHLDFAAVGDHKVVWELNRQQWLILLGQAYRLTGDEKYARGFAGYLAQWLRANPPGFGINWASSLEAALRIISWSWALYLFRNSLTLSADLYVRLLECISLHAAHVEKYLSYYFAPNTHLTGEALGLFYAGAVFPELQSAQRWRDLGARILIEQSERQILADGVYFEQSTCYQRYTAEIYLHFLLLARRSAIFVPGIVEERLRRLLDVLLVFQRPDGCLPDIGDADGGWLLPFMPRAPGDCRGVFAVAARLFDRADYASVASDPVPESMWLLSPARHRSAKAPVPPPSTRETMAFPCGGYVVMRSHWTRSAHQLIFDVGPLSSPKSGHGHADLLSVQCSAFGEPFLVDAGTYCYTSEPEWREFFRGTAAHSTATVDGENQASAAGPFRWDHHPRARLRRCVSTAEYVLADAEHDAYARLADPVTHRRRVVFVKDRYWIIVDDFLGAAKHRIDLRFQFAPMSVANEGENWIRARGQTGHALLLRSFASIPIEIAVAEGSTAPIQGWVSPDYGRRAPAPVVTCSSEVCLPLRILTLLLPLENASAPAPDVLPMLGPSATSGLQFRDTMESIRLDEDTVVFEAAGAKLS
ncbi:MAG TPA: alginate lyase family protein [Candidatus Binatia bacterium]